MFEDLAILLVHPLIQCAQGLDRTSHVHVMDAQVAEPAKAGDYVQGDVLIAPTAGVPRPQAV